MSSRFRGDARHHYTPVKAQATTTTVAVSLQLAEQEDDLDHCSLDSITRITKDDVPKNDEAPVAVPPLNTDDARTAFASKRTGLRIDLDDKKTYRRTRSTGLDTVDMDSSNTAVSSSPMVYRRPHSWDHGESSSVPTSAALEPTTAMSSPPPLSPPRQASLARRLVSQLLWKRNSNSRGSVERKDSNRPYQQQHDEIPAYSLDETTLPAATANTMSASISLGTGTVSLLSSVPNSSNNNYSSHTYEPDESEVWRAYTARTHYHYHHSSDNGTACCAWWTVEQTYSLKRWLLTVVIGIVQAILATACNFATRALSAWKYEMVATAMVTTMQPRTSTSTGTEPEWEDNNSASLWWGDVWNNSSSTLDATLVNPLSASTAVWPNALALFVAIQLVFALIASLCVCLEPASGGSGIPEVKCCLNGIHMPRLLHGRTLLCKLVGITFSVAAGFPIGMEGPMVHSGAIVAALVCQYSSGGNPSNSSGGGASTNRSTSRWWSWMWTSAWTWCTRRPRRRRRPRRQHRALDHAQSSGIEYHRPDNTDDDDTVDDVPTTGLEQSEKSNEKASRSAARSTTTTRWTRLDFRNDQEQRDFVACGAAAGVCSAFGSPIGGVLFALEEASSYFSTKLTW
jgi:Voltage gated chloride channel